MKHIDREHYRLSNLYFNLQKQKSEATEQQDDLLLQKNSLKDYDWIELTLIRELGVVPENSTKIYFKR